MSPDRADSREWLPPAIRNYDRIPQEAIRDLCRIDNLHSALALSAEYLMLAAAFFAALRLPFWCYPLLVIFIGSRQQAFIVLMHEASHRKLFRSARWNDFAGEVLLAWPLFISMFSYRSNHCAHHHYMNTELDPDWVRYLTPDAEERENWTYCRTRWQVMRPLVMDLIGLGALAQVRRVIRLARPRNHDPRRSGAAAEAAVAARYPMYPRTLLWGFRAVLLTAVTLMHAWPIFLLYWILPALTMLKMCTRLRLMAGHFAIFEGEGIRTTMASPIERLLLSPHSIGYHVEHHLYPAVYVSRLPELHRILEARGDFGADLPFRVTRGYWELMADWTRDACTQRSTQPLLSPAR